MKDIFCRIIEGEIPGKVVYEDDVLMVIMDVNPRSNGHLLIIPKAHYQDLYDIKENIINHIMKIARDMSLLVTEKLGCEGVTLEQNNGIIQEVKHFHLHVIPKYSETKEINEVEDIYNMLIG